jgi:hypothetical protein
VTYVLGIDPGGTTGLCLLRVPDGGRAIVVYLREIPGGTRGIIEHWHQMLDWPKYVVYESFALDGRTPKPDLTPVEIIGVLKSFEYAQAGRTQFTAQPNVQGKSLMTNDVLKRAGYYPERGLVKGGHGVDAMRHALTYVVKNLKHRPTIEHLFPKGD